MEVWITRSIEALIFPPGLNIALGILGLYFLKRRPTTAIGLLSGSLVLLWLLSVPRVADALGNLLEDRYAVLTSERIKKDLPQAIVVIGTGRYDSAPEYGGRDSVSQKELVRLRYAASLYKQNRLPILVSGGSPLDEEEPEAMLMQRFLQEELSVPVRWIEGVSRTTHENARFSQEMLAQSGIERVILIAHAALLPRAVNAFEKAGLKVTPAPVGFNTLGKDFGILPQAYSLQYSVVVLHELLGELWYRLRH